MEKRVILTIVICMGLLLVWQQIFPPPKTLPSKKVDGGVAAAKADGGAAGARRDGGSSSAEPAKKAGATFPFFYRLFVNKFYIDDFYQWCINYVVLGFAKVIAFFDRAVVNDTGVNGSGQIASAVGWLLKYQQTGKLPNYALAMILGVAVIAIVGFSVKG